MLYFSLVKNRVAVILSIFSLLVSLVSAYFVYTTKQFVYDAYQVMNSNIDIKIAEDRLKFIEGWSMTNERFFREAMCEMGNKEFCGEKK